MHLCIYKLTNTALPTNLLKDQFIMKLSLKSKSLLRLAFILVSFGVTLASAQSVSLVKGWNLLGNGTTSVITVANSFPITTTTSNVTSIWKWDAATTTWAFYTPTTADGGASYAAGQKYEFLTTIQPGEGYWVNAAASFSFTPPSGNSYSLTNFEPGATNALRTGWNLISIGDGVSAPVFNVSIGPNSSSGVKAPINVTSLWAWDNTNAKWYFYAPLYDDGSNLLSTYIGTQGYESFPSNSLTNGVGFWVNNPGSSTSSTTGTSTSTSTSNPAFMPPATFDAAIKASYQPSSLKSADGFTTRGRYLISDTSSASPTANYLTVDSIATSIDAKGTNTGYAATATNLTTSSTIKNYLSSLMLAVASADGNFRIESHLNPNDAIDYNSSTKTLQFTNSFGLTSSTTTGYITFSYNSTKHLIQAKSRYIYGLTSATNSNNPDTNWTQAYTLDSNFTGANYYLSLKNGVYSLVSSESSSTTFWLYDSPFDFGIPADFNPSSISYVSNSPAPFITKVSSLASVETSSVVGSIYGQVKSAYNAQVLYPGSNATTKASADAMLATIVSTASANNFTLRYSPAVYTAYRDATLAYTLSSDSVVDGRPGQHLVPFVYYTNEKDSSGVYHPMMVIVHYGNQASPTGLIDVARPPGAGSTGSYATSTVTRSANLDYYIHTIPMRDYGVVTSPLDNTFTPSLYSDQNSNKSPTSTTTNLVYSYASTADNGLLINGQVIFPVMNNTIVPSQSQAELSASGCHVGQGGGGPHCHADGYKSGIQYGIGVYGDSDYVGATHPPIIGFGYDGIALYGRYRTGTGTDDSGLSGASVSLDQFGGHIHSTGDSLGYHYHANTIVWPASGSTPAYTLHVLIKGAWAGKINTVPFFYTNSSFNNNVFMGGNVQ